MRVTIEHREERGGLVGDGRSYYVDCTVQFSEEEKAIIRARGMQTHFIFVDPPTRPPDLFEYMTAGVLMICGPLVTVIGMALIFGSIFMGLRSLQFGIFLFVAAPCLWSIGYLMDRRINFLLKKSKDRIAVRTLQTSKFSVYSPDPAYSEVVEHDIREQLTNLKQRIMGSAEIKEKQSYTL